VSATPRLRRSQADRRAATQAALLDAAIETLVEVGYAALTTRGVSDRAGVSQGAQQHYFPTKAALVQAAIGRVAPQLIPFLIGEADDPGGSERERVELLLDRMWEIHLLPATRAAFELYNAARTDPELAAGIASAHNQAAALTQAAAAQVVPELATMPGFADWVLVALSMMRGAAFVSAIPGTAAGVADWPTTRTHLLYGLDRLVVEAGRAF
jgi:AcrR family transcriptional regulator